MPRQPMAFMRLQCARLGTPSIAADHVGVFQAVRRMLPLAASDELAAASGCDDFSPELMAALSGGESDAEGDARQAHSFGSLIPKAVRRDVEPSSLVSRASVPWTASENRDALLGYLHALLRSDCNLDLFQRTVRLAQDHLKVTTKADSDALLRHGWGFTGHVLETPVEEQEDEKESSATGSVRVPGVSRSASQPWEALPADARRDYLSELLYDGGVMRAMGMLHTSTELEWLFPDAHIVQIKGATSHVVAGIVKALVGDLLAGNGFAGEGKDLHIMAGNYKNLATQAVVQTLVGISPPLVPDGITFRSVLVRWSTIASWREEAMAAAGTSWNAGNKSGWAAGKTVDLL